MTSSSTDTRQIRKFGAITLIFFGVLFCLALWRHKLIVTYVFGILSLLGFCFLIAPQPLTPIYASWLKVAHFIGKVMTIVILTVAYYLVITPSAQLKRLFGGRPLPLAPDKNATTYWVPRTEPAQPKERFIKRY
jgi:hypothetical protein